MLAKLRENSRSVIIWVLFGIIIAFFIISFGPQAGHDQFACGGRAPFAAEVAGREISLDSWRFVMNALGFGGGSGKRNRARRAKETAMDRLIERELFAQFAESLGYRLSDRLVDERIAAGKILVVGSPLPGRRIYFDADGAFDYDALKRFAAQLGLTSAARFRDEQRRELLAELGRQQIAQGVRVSPEEVETRYRLDNDTVAFDFVQFDPRAYEQRLALSPEQVRAFLAARADEVKRRYDLDAALYKGVKPQVRVRILFTAREHPPASGDAGPVDPTLDPAHARIAAARARIEAGEPFERVAAEISEDEHTKYRGGDLGWRPAASVVPDQAVTDAIAKLAEGQLSDIITTDRGFYLVRVDGRREGDLSFDDVKLDIAERLAREYHAREAARADAEKALAEAKASGKPLRDLFPADGGDEDGPKTGAVVRRAGPVVLAADPPVPAPAGAQADTAAPALEVVRPADVPAPKVQTARGVKRGPVIAGANNTPYLGRSPELAAALFSDWEPNTLADRVFEVDGRFVVVEFKERTKPDMEAFASQRPRLTEAMRRERARRAVDDWALARCREVANAGDILVNTELVTYNDPDTGDPLPVTYKLCSQGLPGL